ncbi:hypothetical protein NSMS1_64620 (plasmid) [Nostoc sp. MS1]|nr:hypothetical protein NSMS1_64620 [Nostoc sp. MS1]
MSFLKFFITPNKPCFIRKKVLKINNLVLPYYKFFKHIQYFLDREGLIYWGKIKKIIKYGSNYAIEYDKRIFVERKTIAIKA